MGSPRRILIFFFITLGVSLEFYMFGTTKILTSSQRGGFAKLLIRLGGERELFGEPEPFWRSHIVRKKEEPYQTGPQFHS